MILVYVLVFVMPLARHGLWSGTHGDLTLVKYVGAGASLYALVYLAGRSWPRFFATGQARWFVMFALITMGSYLVMGAEDVFGRSPFMSGVSFLQLFFITLVVVDSLERLRTLLLVTIGSAGFASLYVLREWQNMGFARGYRPGWITGDPNYFSISALLCLPLAFCMLRTRLKRWEWWFCAACLGLTLLALTAASSRGGFLGLVAALAVGTRGVRRRARIVAAGLALLVPLMLVSPSSPLRRLFNPSRGDEQATQSRVETWQAGIRMIAAHPVFGVGAGRFKSELRRLRVSADDSAYIAHNTYIQVGAELGIPGLAAFLGALVCSLRTAQRVRKATTDLGPPLVRAAAQGIETGLVGFGVAAFFISAEYQKLFWLLVFLSMCLPSLAREQVRERRRRAEGPGSSQRVAERITDGPGVSGYPYVIGCR